MNETKIIKTFRGELIFLISVITFLGGILAAYFSLVKDVAVMKTEQTNQTALLTNHFKQFDDHLEDNKKDHDILIDVIARLKL